MSYEAYKAYLSNISTPMQVYKDDLQAMIDNEFNNASDLYTIQEELNRGSKVFTDAKVRITHVIDSETGDKLGDDWRGIIFSSIEHQDGLGYMYQFDDNYWLTISSDMYKFVTASACVRRCNNVLNKYIYDTNNKKLMQEPCVIDYKVSRDMFKYAESLILPQADIYVITQNNDNVKNININDRFLFDGEPFKVQMKNGWQREQTMLKNSAPLIYLSCIKDQISPLDDLENNIADGLPAKNINNTSVIISPIITKIKINHSQNYSIYKYDDQNNKLADTFTITVASTIPTNLDTNYYTLTIVDSNNFTINNLKGNGTQYIIIHCVDNSDNTKFEDIKINLAGRW